MSPLWSLLGLALTLYMLILIARMVLDWISATGSDTPQGVRRAREFAHKATEPIIGPVRRVVPPLRLGSVSIDLAFTLVFIAVVFLRGIAYSM
ncbi:MAG: YggT family protein [Mycobacteriaceae bacterium]|nr:YggT family protein [Mycobacteriaceae bacterium]